MTGRRQRDPSACRSDPRMHPRPPTDPLEGACPHLLPARRGRAELSTASLLAGHHVPRIRSATERLRQGSQGIARTPCSRACHHSVTKATLPGDAQEVPCAVCGSHTGNPRANQVLTTTSGGDSKSQPHPRFIGHEQAQGHLVDSRGSLSGKACHSPPICSGLAPHHGNAK